MAEDVRVSNPHEVPVEVPGYGVLSAGASATVQRSAALRRALQHGRVVEGSKRSASSASSTTDDEGSGSRSGSRRRKR